MIEIITKPNGKVTCFKYSHYEEYDEWKKSDLTCEHCNVKNCRSRRYTD